MGLGESVFCLVCDIIQPCNQWLHDFVGESPLSKVRYVPSLMLIGLIRVEIYCFHFVTRLHDQRKYELVSGSLSTYATIVPSLMLIRLMGVEI